MAAPLPREPYARRTVLLLAALSAGATAVRIVHFESLTDRGLFAKYLVFADQLLAGTTPVERLPDLSLGYLWTVAALRGPLGLEALGIVRLQLLLVGLTAIAVGALACRLAGPLAGWAGCLSMLCSKGAWLNATELEPETAAMALGAAALTVLLWRPPGGPTAAAAGLLLGLSALLRPTVLPAAAALAAWCWWSVRTRSGGSRRAALAPPLLLLLATLLPPFLAHLTRSHAERSGATMNPGTVLYEGWNPMATGYLGEAPRVVKEIERGLGQPDALHVAYRRVAAAAGAGGANRFWAGLARASVVELPVRAAALAADKAWFALHSHEAWDLLTVWRRQRLVAGAAWIPFGAIAGLALVPATLLRRRPEAVPLLAWTAAYLAVMVGFYVTSRQRNPIVPAVALLAALGVEAQVRTWRAGDRRRAVAAAVVVALAAALLIVPWHPQREDGHAWRTTAEVHAAARLAAEADDPGRAAQLWGEVAVRLGAVPEGVPQAAVHAAIARRLDAGSSLASRFDAALASARIGDRVTAERVLAELDVLGYRARRGFEVTGSVAYHRARCRLALGDLAGAWELAARAAREVPGDPWAAALAAELGLRVDAEEAVVRRQRRILEGLNDPFTAGSARARALADLGDRQGAAELLEELARRLPEIAPPSGAPR